MSQIPGYLTFGTKRDRHLQLITGVSASKLLLLDFPCASLFSFLVFCPFQIYFSFFAIRRKLIFMLQLKLKVSQIIKQLIIHRSIL